MPSWKVRSNSSERAKSWITVARQAGPIASCMTTLLQPFWGNAPWDAGSHSNAAPATVMPSAGARTEQGVGGRAAGALPVDLGLHPRHFGPQDVQAFLQFGDPEQLQILAAGLVEPLTAADPDLGRFVHRASLLCGP